jgi:hypothetical protein
MKQMEKHYQILLIDHLVGGFNVDILYIVIICVFAC